MISTYFCGKQCCPNKVWCTKKANKVNSIFMLQLWESQVMPFFTYIYLSTLNIVRKIVYKFFLNLPRMSNTILSIYSAIWPKLEKSILKCFLPYCSFGFRPFQHVTTLHWFSHNSKYLEKHLLKASKMIIIQRPSLPNQEL